MLIWLGLVILGVLVGLISGLLGIGGGIISAPMLMLASPYMNIHPAVAMHLAVGTSLAISALTLISSLVQHYKNNNIDFGIFFQFLPGNMLGAIIGPYIVSSLPESILSKIIGILFIALAINMSFDFYNRTGVRLPKLPWMILSGFIFGMLATFVGVSGAIFIIPFLTLFGVALHKSVGVAAMCGVPLSFIGMFSNIYFGFHAQNLPEGATGFVYWPAVFAITITSMPISYWAAKKSNKMPIVLLKKSLAVLLVIIAIKMLFFK